MINTGADVYLDIQGLGQLKGMANRRSKQALREVARQFESVFLKMMLKSMRDASFGDPLFESENSAFYRDMYDHQLSLELSKAGSIGLADMLVRQLSRFVENEPQNDGRTRKLPAREEGAEIEPPRVEVKAMPAAAPESMNKRPPALDPVPERPARAAPLLQSALSSAGRSEVLAETAHVARQVSPDTERTMKTTQQVEPASLAPYDPETFIRVLWPLAERSARQLGTSPSVLLAQAGLETGWGRYVLSDAQGRSSYNLFNIKADRRWQGESVARVVVEYRDGVAVKERARFRAYNSYAESFQDYVNFLQRNPRYFEALKQAGNPERFIAELHRAGYATDPDYAGKIITIMQREPSLREARLVPVVSLVGG